MPDCVRTTCAALAVLFCLLSLPTALMAEAFDDPSDDGRRYEAGEALQKAGDEAFRAGDYARAIVLFQRARDHYDGSFNPRDAMFAVFSIGKSRQDSGDLRGAEIAYQDAWQRAKADDYVAGMGLAAAGLGYLYRQAGRRADAIQAFSTAQELYRRGGHPKEAAQSARELAALRKAALSSANRMTRQVDTRPGASRPAGVPPLLPAAGAQIAVPGRARTIAELEAWVEREPGNLSALQMLAARLAVENRPVRSNIFYGKMITLSQETGFDIGWAEAYAGVGLNHIALGNRETGDDFSPAEKRHHLQHAESAYRQAISGFQKLGKWKRLGEVGEHLGNALELQGKLNQANDAYRAALTAYATVKDRPSVGRILLHMAGVRSLAKQYDQSLQIYEKAEKLFRELGDDASRADVLMSSGGDLLRSGRGAEAIEPLRHAAAINGELSRGRQYALSLFYLGIAHSGRGQEQVACENWQAALDVTRRTNQKSLGQRIARLMRRCGR